MKKLIDVLNESHGEFNPSFASHKDAYNSFIKWYDKQLKHMNKDELLDMLQGICTEIENDNLKEIK